MTTQSRNRRVTTLVAILLLITGGTAFTLSSETTRLVEALALEEGMRVADVGAGDGEWAERLARAVGTSGHVYATEIDEDDVEEIADRAAAAGLDNVTALLGTDTDAQLPVGCCEAILLRMVYHHFIDPAPMRTGSPGPRHWM